MKEKWRKLVAEARAILDTAEREGRSMTPEEEQRFDRLMDEADRIDLELSRQERLARIDRRMSEPATDAIRPDPSDPVPGFAGRDYHNPAAGALASPEYRAAFRSFLAGGVAALTPAEARALQVNPNTSGGYIVAPEQFVNRLLKAVDDAVYIRQFATVIPLTQAQSLGVPVLDANPADADWTSEVATVTEDTAMAFGKRELRPHPLSKLIKVSNKIMRTSALDPENLVRDRLAYKFSVTLEKAYLTGDGVGKPLGVFTASNQGISTARDVVCGTATDITGDGLIDVKHALKPQYWRNARWLLSSEALKRIRKLKDSQGQYLWQPGLQNGVPDRILDSPYLVSEFAPNTFATGQYVLLYGDLSFYWIADSLQFQVQRLVELYAATDQTGFIGRYEGDGMPVLEEAFVRGKLA